jgi:flavin-binding protein dodecin
MGSYFPDVPIVGRLQNAAFPTRFGQEHQPRSLPDRRRVSEEAIAQGVKRAAKTLSGITSAWVKDQEVVVSKGKIDEYRVHMKITFILK